MRIDALIDKVRDWLDTETGRKVREAADSLFPGLLPMPKRKRVPVRVPVSPQYPGRRQ